MKLCRCTFSTVVMAVLAVPAWSAPFSFMTGLPDGRMAAADRIPSGGLIEIEAADDFITMQNLTTITSASFWGLLPGSTSVGSIAQVDVEIYRVFPNDSMNPPDGRVPTRVNSPSDNALTVRDSAVPGELTFTATSLGAFSTVNSVLNGIHPIPGQTTGGEGPVSGTEVRFDVNFLTPFNLSPDHYFFVPQVRLTDGSTFYWLSTVGNNPPLFTGDLQAWIRNADLDPNWLRIGTDIVGGSPAPTFDMSFSITGTAVPEPSTLALWFGGISSLFLMRRLRR